jgi:imidazolonepropionase
LALEAEVGSLEPGKQADLVVLETDRYLTLPYHFGIDPVRTVVKSGRVVHDRGEPGGR